MIDTINQPRKVIDEKFDTQNDKRQGLAILLAVFLGFIGIHKLYLGQTGMCILYALFFWTGIPMVVGFIEAILLLNMPEEVFNRKYGGR